MSALPPAWARFVDDAAIFPPGDRPLAEAVTSYGGRGEEWWADLVGSFVVTDVRVPEVVTPLPLSVVVTGGAGAVDSALRLVERGGHELAGLEVALRDPDDLAGNARRVTAAAGAAGLDPERVYVELPPGPDTAGWLRAADEVAAAGMRLKFRTGGLEAHLFPAPATLAGWIDAALDRETPFKCTAGLHHAIRHEDGTGGFTHHGFLNVLVATVCGFAGAPAEEMADVLDERDADALLGKLPGDGRLDGRLDELDRGRRWFTSFGSCSVSEPLEDLLALDLLDKP